MNTERNSGWHLARQPQAGWPSDGDFAWWEADLSEPGPGQALCQTLYLSMDPYQWGRRRAGTEQPGDVCHGRTVSAVVASRHPDFREGDLLFNTNGWQHFGLTGEGIDVFGYMFPRKLDPTIVPISTAIGVMGMLGLTAYSGMLVQCQPRPGETVVVSAASGGVGQVAGQLAKIRGCRVVGITSTPEKCAYVRDDLGFDAAVSHTQADFVDELGKACPDGIDVYFENVGGRVFEAVLPLLNTASRITLCGMISQYGNTEGGNAMDAWMATGKPVFERRNTKVHSLFVGNFVADYQEQFFAEMADWIAAGRIKYREDVWEGLARAPEAFSAMLAGRNFGKTLISVAEDPTLDSEIQRNRAAGNTLER
jgi:NADPH-dependent curcumin reductase CurA